MKEINTEILINASPQKVWAIFSDFQNYHKWNPFIKYIRGNVEAGRKITVRLEPPGARGMTFNPEVLVFEKDIELRWLGNLFFPGLFDGEHRFELVDNGNGTTIFRQSEKFRGILVPLFRKMLDINTTDGFNLMNQKLREMSEQG